MKLFSFIFALIASEAFATGDKNYEWINEYVFNHSISYNYFNKLLDSKKEDQTLFAMAYLSGVVNTLNLENVANKVEGRPLIYCSNNLISAPEVKQLVQQYANSFNGEAVKKFGDDDLYYMVRFSLRYYYQCPTNKN
ncbi:MULTISPECIES: hypothetical protein [unclassified Gilliamella]|uniref:hypothetical protein n=1 Tax=unclassified Gilliamella TaxID=2685620 RepID=UPI001327A23C|nr:MULTISPECIES: hypothetical protein [unclassified Gilliamella]MWN32464.1 hypothetical protein [Gilliamella sp. Pra-s60]MWP29851.1 hypothetical protein [Gilliamella sp. Pra-s54]